MAEIHINVGIVALSRGFITADAFAKVMEQVVQASSLNLQDVWVRGGFISDAQLAQVLDTIGRSSRTAIIPSTTPPGAPLSTWVATGPGPASGLDTTPEGTPAPLPEPAVRPGGDVVGDRYHRVALLGKGGLGEVVSCEDVVLQRTVAVKACTPRPDVDAYSSREILAREARIISSHEHPNLIPIYDAGTDPVRGPFYVMRQVTDSSLDEILRRRHAGEGNPHDYTLNRLLRYFLQACNAVDYAHHHGVVHCDLKPANILLGGYGEVLVVDWGLAQSRDHPLGVRGGTLGYMAPEQLDPSVERFDWCTDVFALGAILYEILCGTPAFEAARQCDVSTAQQQVGAIYAPPRRPTAVDPQLEIPPEVEDIVLRALTIDRGQRVQTVRELADAIDEWIEGSKQRERQRIEADRSADAGDELAERYHEFVEARPEKLTVLRALRADVAPWASLADKQDLWDAEDIIRVTDALQVRTFHSAVSAYERALETVPGHARSRRGLAHLYWAELQRARHRGDALDQLAYEQLLRQVDDGTFVRELQRDGVLELVIGDRIGRVTLAPLGERERRLVEGASEPIPERPCARRDLPAGNYVVTAVVGDGPTRVVWPIGIEPGARCTITVDVPAVGRLDDDEVLVPGGRARLAGDPLGADSDEPIVVDVPAFVLQRYPVSFGAWFAFLEDLRARDPALAQLHTPRATVPGDPDRFPVMGISAESAEAYARWLSERQGRSWRLPTELEWEKAARGTDGRVYPWGDHFDATFCKMRDSRPGLPVVEPIGTYAAGQVAHAVRRHVGGVADWCTPDPRRTAPREPREVVSRGGAWCDWPIDCRLASRRRYLATECAERVGVRLAREP